MSDTQAKSLRIARMMIQRHGLQASAVAEERAGIAQLAPDAEALELWRHVKRAIGELRTPSHRADHRPFAAS